MTAVADQKAVRQYGSPFRGCISVLDRHEVPAGYIGPDSRELLVQPGRVSGLSKVKRRGGSAVRGGNNGVLEFSSALASMRGLEVFALRTLVSGNGFPVRAEIWADESKCYGQVHLLDGATDYVEGHEFGAVYYSTAGGTTTFMKVPPIPYDANGGGSGATGYTRMAFEEARRHVVAGTRRHTGFGTREYFGGFKSAPTNWGRDYNLDPAGATTNVLRHFPTFLIPPLRTATRVDGDYPAIGAQGQWQWGDQYYEAWGFEFEDGSRSMPTIPRAPQPAGLLTAGLGLVTVGKAADAAAVSPNNNYGYVPDRNIRRGPFGTRKRIKYRSNKITKAQAAAGAVPDITTLKLAAIIDDNTTTTYNDPNGDDTALVDDPLLRLDQIAQPRSRYDWAFDQRHGCGYLRQSPYAIVLAPTGDGAAGDVNVDDNTFDAVDGNRALLVQLIQDTTGSMTLKLRRVALGGGAPADTVFAALTVSLQDLVDAINGTVVGGNAKEWRAAIVPGAGAQVLVPNLAPTQVSIANCQRTINTPDLTTAPATFDFSQVAEGAKVNDAAFPAGTYVKQKVSNQHLIMSANATATAGPTDCEFYYDTGDDITFTDATAHSQHGNFRAWGNAVPVPLAFKQSYLDLSPTEKRSFRVTSGGPTDKPNAAMLFHTSIGGHFEAEAAAGIFMGAAPLRNGCVVFYANQIGYWKNEHAGTTGIDSEYRMTWIEYGTGCKSPYSIIHGNGWVGCWTNRGFWVYDGQDSAIISGHHYDPNTGAGDFAYEAALCAAAAEADTNDYYMHASYVDGRIWLNLRIEAGTFATFCYDASINVQSLGLRQILTQNDPDQDELTRYTTMYQTPLNVPTGPPTGSAFGWSPRCTYNWRSLPEGTGGAIGAVIGADGIHHLYQCDDKNDRANGGIVQEFETVGNFKDGADKVVWELYTTTDMANGMKKFALGERMTFLFKNLVYSGASSVQGMIFRNQKRTGGAIFTLPLTGIAPDPTEFFSRKTINAGMPARSPGDVVEIWLHNGVPGNDDDADFELSGIMVPILMLDSVN